MKRANVAAMAALAGTVGVVGSSAGQTLTWLNPAGGNVGAAGNWNPAQIPGPANTLVFNLAASYGLTFPAGVTASANLTFARGAQTLTINAPHTTGVVTIGSVNGASDTVTLATGSLNGGDVRIGSAFGAAGTLNVNDDDAILTCSQLSVASNTNQVCTVNVTNAGLIEASSVVIGDDNPLGEGRVVVSGRTRIFPPLLSTLRSSGSLVVGRDGVGSLSVASGALVEVGGAMSVAQNVSAGPTLSEGEVTVGGAGLGLPATLAVGSTLRIGRGSTSGSDTGNGTLTINDDGAVTVAGSTTVGGSGVGSGVLRVNSGGRLTTAGLSFGASGDFQHAGGVVTVNGGGFTHDETTLVVDGAADTSLVFDGLAGSVSFTPDAGSEEAVTLGDAGAGSMTARNGSDLVVTRGVVMLGKGAGSSGTLAIESGASLTVGGGGNIQVGGEGTGNLTVRSGGSMIGGSLFVSLSNGGGTVLVEDAGTALVMGAISLRSGAAMTVRDGAVVALSGAFGVQIPVQAGATLVVDHATLNATTDVSVDGLFTLVNGTINAAAFRRSVPVSASGAIHAEIATGAAIVATGDLVLGDESPDGFSATDLTVGGHRVELVDSNSAQLRVTTIAGGELVGASLRLPAGATLTGTGTVTGAFANLGSITATGASGLTFRGFVSGIGQGISGSKVTFASGGGFVGAGTIAAKVQNDLGAVLEFTGASTIGDGSSTGFTGAGELDITGGLTISDGNGVNLGSRTTLRNSVLACPSTMNVGSTGVVRGSGAIAGRLECSGTLAPGIAGVDESSQITINGSYTQVNGGLGTLEIDLEGPDVTQSDLLAVNGGSAELRGTVRVRQSGGFTPENGYERVIVLANPVVFEPAAVELPPRFHLVATGTSLRVVYCSADFNNDGFIDFFDYDGFVECFETGACPEGETADFNGDEFVDFFDYDAFVLAFETGC